MLMSTVSKRNMLKFNKESDIHMVAPMGAPLGPALSTADEKCVEGHSSPSGLVASPLGTWYKSSCGSWFCAMAANRSGGHLDGSWLPACTGLFC